ncbi:MAG: aminoacyl-tRNA hydrolase [Varibaculum sp.]|nr:aminoacyl-tRNA hydrolase [Varibaculum sp.]
MFLVFGLGNPGEKYAGTRHNVGRITVELLAEQTGESFGQEARFGAYTATIRMGAEKVMLGYSAGYMNDSGRPLGALARYYRLDPSSDLLVIHDDLDLPEHTLRLARNRSEAGHNGLKSITQHLGTRDYARLRIGIGRPPGYGDKRQEVVSWVLGRARDNLEWDVTYSLAADAVTDCVENGFLAAQGHLHSAQKRG